MAVKVIRKFRLLYDVTFGTPSDGDVATYDQATDKVVMAAPAGGSPSGAAGGVLSGTYPNPGFAVDMATQAELDAHISDASDAHAGSAITNTPAGGIASTTVQAAINELDSEKAALASAVMDGDAAGGVLAGTYPNPSFAADMATQAELDGHVNDTSDAHDASAISVLDTGGNFTATDVEAALAELHGGPRVVSMFLTAPDGALATGDGKAFWRVPAVLNGFNVTAVAGANLTTSSSGNPTFQLRRKRGASSVDVLSTALTIDAGDLDSKDAATAAVVNTSNDDLATGDILFVDCDAAGTGTLGVTVDVTIQAP